MPFTLKVDGKKAHIAINQPLDPGAQLKLSLTAEAKDASGAALDRAYAWSYRVMPFKLSDLQCSQWRIEFHLSYSVQAESLQQNISVDPPIKGKWQGQAGNLDFSIEPEQALDWAQRYTISFKEPLKDTDGKLLPAIGPFTCAVTPPFFAAPENCVWIRSSGK